MDVLPPRMFMNHVGTSNWSQALYNLLCVHVCHDAHVQVREQLSGVNSLLPPLCGFQGSDSGHQAWQVLYPLSPLTVPTLVCSVCYCILPVTLLTMCDAMCLYPALRRLRQEENPEFEATLSYIVMCICSGKTQDLPMSSRTSSSVAPALGGWLCSRCFGWCLCIQNRIQNTVYLVSQCCPNWDMRFQFPRTRV